ncbi:MAG: FHA domain-containing protein [Anaerolineae bacterium]
MSFPNLSGNLPGVTLTQWPLDTNAFLIGREPPAQLVIPLRPISRQQARITCIDQSYYIADLDSRNGTFVNGEPLGREPRRLHDGDEIVLAGVVTLTFNDPGETSDGPRVGRLTGVWIDPEKHLVWVDGRQIEPPLSAAQYQLLTLLYFSPGQIISREVIVNAVWPDVAIEGVSEEAVDALIKRLRQRLREAQPDRDYIQVIRKQGLRLNNP